MQSILEKNSTDYQLLPLQQKTSMEVVMTRWMTSTNVCEALTIRSRQISQAERVGTVKSDLSWSSSMKACLQPHTPDSSAKLIVLQQMRHKSTETAVEIVAVTLRLTLDVRTVGLQPKAKG
ncbi:MAG: hypothetical protein EOO38_31945 [Cytophagaceae bacterium]|nr:MAG: hypothetical protein EOO38_31945 [Cytophagaceae bacterium]